MKKSSKSGRSWVMVVSIVAFLAVCWIAVYAATNFTSSYGSGGALSDDKITKEEWNALMKDLDSLSCPSCPAAVKCDSCCNATSCSDGSCAMYQSPNKKYIHASKPEVGQLCNEYGACWLFGKIESDIDDNTSLCNGKKGHWSWVNLLTGSEVCGINDGQCDTNKVRYTAVGGKWYKIQYTYCAPYWGYLNFKVDTSRWPVDYKYTFNLCDYWKNTQKNAPFLKSKLDSLDLWWTTDEALKNLDK